MPSERDKTRWWQFNLRNLFIVLTTIAIILALGVAFVQVQMRNYKIDVIFTREIEDDAAKLPIERDLP